MEVWGFCLTVAMCAFSKRYGHTLYKCRKIMERPVEERVKFVQSEKLCFGCLKIGHNPKGCTSRCVCDKCEKCHQINTQDKELEPIKISQRSIKDLQKEQLNHRRVQASDFKQSSSRKECHSYLINHSNTCLNNSWSIKKDSSVHLAWYSWNAWYQERTSQTQDFYNNFQNKGWAQSQIEWTESKRH